MNTCDVCGILATVLVSCPSNGLGSDPRFGSFSSYRCDPHAREAIAQHKAAGYTDLRVTLLDPHEAGILAERDRANAKALSESSSPVIRELAGDLDRIDHKLATLEKKNLSFKEALEAFRQASLCPTCGKATAVLNVASRGFRAERVTPASHCTCTGGPVDLQTRGHLQPLELAGSGREIV